MPNKYSRNIYIKIIINYCIIIISPCFGFFGFNLWFFPPLQSTPSLSTLSIFLVSKMAQCGCSCVISPQLHAYVEPVQNDTVSIPSGCSLFYFVLSQDCPLWLLSCVICLCCFPLLYMQKRETNARNIIHASLSYANRSLPLKFLTFFIIWSVTNYSRLLQATKYQNELWRLETWETKLTRTLLNFHYL